MHRVEGSGKYRDPRSKSRSPEYHVYRPALVKREVVGYLAYQTVLMLSFIVNP
jgi:hypothetical protein